MEQPIPAITGVVRSARILRLALPALAVLAATGSSYAQDAPGSIVDVRIPEQGRAVYEEICQACHMADAKGGEGAGARIPALAGNPRLADRSYAVAVAVKGRGGMPGFTEMLSDEQLAAVLTYVRGHFNAYADPVTPAEIAAAKTTGGSAPDCNCVN